MIVEKLSSACSRVRGVTFRKCNSQSAFQSSDGNQSVTENLFIVSPLEVCSEGALAATVSPFVEWSRPGTSLGSQRRGFLGPPWAGSNFRTSCSVSHFTRAHLGHHL